jgi:hypothetical protein
MRPAVEVGALSDPYCPPCLLCLTGTGRPHVNDFAVNDLHEERVGRRR